MGIGEVQPLGHDRHSLAPVRDLARRLTDPGPRSGPAARGTWAVEVFGAALAIRLAVAGLARRTAWIYATCPVAIMLVCLQGQWDAVWLLPAVCALALTETAPHLPRSLSAAAGALVGLAVLVKLTPIALAALAVRQFRQ